MNFDEDIMNNLKFSKTLITVIISTSVLEKLVLYVPLSYQLTFSSFIGLYLVGLNFKTTPHPLIMQSNSIIKYECCGGNSKGLSILMASFIF